MAGNTVRVQADTIRSIAEASITASYAEFGDEFSHPARIICITNNTNGDMLFSLDGTNDHFFLPMNSFRLYDITSSRLNADPGWFFGVGTQFFIKYSTNPTTGSVYLEVLWGE